MNPDFQTGLEFVRESLTQLKGWKGDSLHASREALERLVAAREIAPAVPPRRAEEPATRERKMVAPAMPIAQSPSHEPVKIAPPRATEPSDGPARLEALRGPVLSCTKCPHLARSRTQVVFGVGNPEAELMFVGEAPGADEDAQGEPFVGKAGQLLTKIIEAMGYGRGEVYIANVLKCRPDMPGGRSGNRPPTPIEMETCLPYLREQIGIVRPRVLVALGGVAIAGLIGADEPMRKLRGRWHTFQDTPLMATYHPAYLLRNQSLGEKRKVWEDMLMVLEKLDRPISDRQRNFFLKKQ